MKHVRDCGTVRTTVNSSQVGLRRVGALLLGYSGRSKADRIRVRGLPGRALTPRKYGKNEQKDARQPCILPMDVPKHNPRAATT